MALIDLITEEVVKVPLTSQSKFEIIKELIQLLHEKGHLEQSEAAYDAVLNRESQGSTGLENGIAVPHAKTDTVKGLTIAIGISPAGIDFEALDGNPSHLFFLMLAPPDQPGPHIEALAEIARLTRSKAFCNMVTSAVSAREVVEIFRED
jgi:fructose-specific phosphotransferase system IIA component